MKLKRILCPVDFSESCNFTVQYAESLAKLFDARLYLLNVVRNRNRDENRIILHIAPQGIAGNMKKKAEIQLNNLANTIKKRVETKIEVRDGISYIEIVKTAEEEDIDLIVMGSHDQTGESRVPVKNVSEWVVRIAQCPVLIVNAKNTKIGI